MNFRRIENWVVKKFNPINRIGLGSNILEKPWDICCLLDGCRVDTFRQTIDQCNSYWSLGSTSQEWIPRTFEGHDLSKIAYITGNPHSNKVNTSDFGFFHLEPTRESKYIIDTVKPSKLAKQAIAVWRERERFGIDRMVVHFMQPHVPFRSKPSWFMRYTDKDEWGSNRWKYIDKKYPLEEWMDAYQDNLEWVFEDGCKPILNNTNSLVFLTSDHGNLYGEWGSFGHPKNSIHPNVRKVPSYYVQGKDKRRIFPELKQQESVDIEQQLADLGYL